MFILTDFPRASGLFEGSPKGETCIFSSRLSIRRRFSQDVSSSDSAVCSKREGPAHSLPSIPSSGCKYMHIMSLHLS